MGNIFYNAGCRAALVKLGAVTPENPLYFMDENHPDFGDAPNMNKAMLSWGAHGLGGGLAGAGLGALLSKSDRGLGAFAEGTIGSTLGLLGKGIANDYRGFEIEDQAAPRLGLVNEYLANVKGAPNPEREKQFYDALGARNAEIARQKSKMEGFGY